MKIIDNGLDNFTKKQCVQTIIVIWEQLRSNQNVSSVYVL